MGWGNQLTDWLSFIDQTKRLLLHHGLGPNPPHHDAAPLPPPIFPPFQSPTTAAPIMDAPLQALIAAAVSFFFVSVIFTLILLCRRLPVTNPIFPHSQAQTPSPPPPPPRPPLPESSAFFDPNLDRISMSDLTAATNNFSPDAIVGDGSFGFVYKARLPSSGILVAVKRLSADAAFHGLREFHAEMETLGRVRHPNLARLLGYCAAGPDRLLIYEFLVRGSLDSWLHDPVSSSSAAALTWPIRRRVARGAAAGLAFLHHECRPRIIHRDIKASNVLLDADFEPRIADFGLARRVESSRSHVSTQVAGTMGYMPPEYREGMVAATVRADVYSFGVLMLELATGRRPNWPVRREEDGREEMLVRWARRMVEEGRGMEMVDEGMMRSEGGVVAEEMKGYLGVAYRCTDESSKNRPSMGEVVSMLDQL